MLSRKDLHNYQIRAIDFIKDRQRVFLMLDLGLGKTVSTLTAVSDLLDSFAIRRALVVAPLRVANSVWKQEAARWEHLKHLHVQICTGLVRERIASLHRSADIYVINRENVSWLVDFYGNRWPFDCLVVDESSSFKNSSSKRFKALRKVLPNISHRILLSGTPSPNGLHDLWAQCYMIDYGQALGRTLTTFRAKYFEADYNGFGYKPRKDISKQVYGKIAPYCISMSAKDYLELPERISINHEIALPKAALAQYEDFEKDLFIDLDGGVEIEAINAAVLAGKLLQFSSGAMYTDEAKNFKVIHDEKISAIIELVEENANEPILIAYNFKSDLERLIRALPNATVLDKSPRTIQDWNDGKIPILLAHPASCGHGINLQRGGSLIIWFALSWSLELYQQLNARLHRQGQDKPVRIINLICKDTIEERVIKILSSKDVVQKDLLYALRAN